MRSVLTIAAELLPLALFWVLLALLISRVTRWRQLLQLYRHDGPLPGTLFRLQSARLGRLSLRHSFNVYISKEGLGLEPNGLIFWPWGRVLIPWLEMDFNQPKRWGFQGVTLHLFGLHRYTLSFASADAAAFAARCPEWPRRAAPEGRAPGAGHAWRLPLLVLATLLATFACWRGPLAGARALATGEEDWVQLRVTDGGPALFMLNGPEERRLSIAPSWVAAPKLVGDSDGQVWARVLVSEGLVWPNRAWLWVEASAGLALWSLLLFIVEALLWLPFRSRGFRG